jgi:hypothetical protein
MANGEGFAGPVNQATMLQMQGAMETERGFARAWSAGADPAVQAAYQRSAAERGAMAANNIRMRYYQKEWEQIQSTEITPYHERLRAAEANRNAKMAMRVLPATRTIGLAEGAGIKAAAELPTPGAVQPKDANGQALPPPPEPNVAMQPGLIGAQETTDALSYMDVATGRVIPVDSAEGVSWMQAAEREFWEEYTAVNREMMDTLSGYQGNPYASQAMSNLMKHTSDISGQAVTGQRDPMAALNWWQDFQNKEAQRELQQQEAATGAFNIRASEGMVRAYEADARVRVQDPEQASYYGRGLAKKLLGGKPLTQEEQATVAGVGELLKEKEQRAAQQWARPGAPFRLSPLVHDEPLSWMDYSSRDPVRQQRFGAIVTDEAQKTKRALISAEDPEDAVRWFESKGAPTRILALARVGAWEDRELQEWMEATIQTPELVEHANAVTFIERLPHYEAMDPRIAPTIDAVNEKVVEQVRRRVEATGQTFTDEAADLIRADRERTFYEGISGKSAPRVRGMRTTKRRKDVREAYRTRRLLEEEEVAAEAPAALLTPAPEFTPEPEAGPTPEIQAPAEPDETETTGAAGAWEKAYPGARVPGLGVVREYFARGAEETLARHRALPRPPSRYGAGTELGNPYLNMAREVLLALRETLPVNSQARVLIEEALAAKGETPAEAGE